MMKADEVRLYALRGGFLKQAVCYTHFHSNKVFRGDLYKIVPGRITVGAFLSLKCINIRGYFCGKVDNSRRMVYNE